MMTIINPGPQSTLQGPPRTGWRHMGMPWAGPADAWSMALANHLVGNAADVTSIEITLGLFEVRFKENTYLALTGALTVAEISGAPIPFHEAIFAPAGSILKLGGARAGMRTYLAVAGGIIADEFLGSASTYLPAGLGGFQGRALQGGDHVPIGPQPKGAEFRRTPEEARPTLSETYALRCTPAGETDLLSSDSVAALFDTEFVIGRQATRMGVSLEGAPLSLNSDGKMKSAAVFPGTVQCPENGTPIILLADAQTTGGYPRIGSIARCDRHMLGQLRPGDKLRLLSRTHAEALADLKSKHALLRSWVPDFVL